MAEKRVDRARRRRGAAGRSVEMAAAARRRVVPPERPPARARAGRVWLNGRELGAPDSRYAHLGASHD